jgi:hypothetical protein
VVKLMLYQKARPIVMSYRGEVARQIVGLRLSALRYVTKLEKLLLVVLIITSSTNASSSIRKSRPVSRPLRSLALRTTSRQTLPAPDYIACPPPPWSSARRRSRPSPASSRTRRPPTPAPSRGYSMYMQHSRSGERHWGWPTRAPSRALRGRCSAMSS